MAVGVHTGDWFSPRVVIRVGRAAVEIEGPDVGVASALRHRHRDPRPSGETVGVR
jgi:hypothetical protein